MPLDLSEIACIIIFLVPYVGISWEDQYCNGKRRCLRTIVAIIRNTTTIISIHAQMFLLGPRRIFKHCGTFIIMRIF